MLIADARKGNPTAPPAKIVFGGWTAVGGLILKRGSDTWAVDLAGAKQAAFEPAPAAASTITVGGGEDRPAVMDGSKTLFPIALMRRELDAWAVSADGKRVLIALGPPVGVEPGEGEELPSGTRFELWSVIDRKLVGAFEVDRAGVVTVALTGDGAHGLVGWRDGKLDSFVPGDACYRWGVADSRDERARARAGWPVARYRLGEEPADLLDGVAPADCVAMVWQLTLDAWTSSGQPMPDYSRAMSPGRVLRRHVP